jgi:integrase
MLLRTSNEPITKNIGKRMAFLIGTSVEERMAIVQNVDAAYRIRSKFIHQGNSVDAIPRSSSDSSNTRGDAFMPCCSRSTFPRLTEDEPRKGFLKPELYQKLLFELPEVLRLLFVIAYHVGLRKGALLRIKWPQVDLKANTIWMEGRKSNRKPEPVAVPIYGDMAKFIEMQPRTSEYLFARGSKPIRDFRESGDLACQRAGVPDLQFHDLRRTAVRNLRRAGVPETVIMKITGHRTRSVFERYNITDETDTQEAGRKAEVFLAREHEEVAQITSQKPERIN